MGDVWREIRQAVRGLARAPGFTVVAVLTLAIGIGANALIYGVVDAVVLRPLPYPQADRLVSIWSDEALSMGEFETAVARARSLEVSAAWNAGVGVNLELQGEAIRLGGSEVTADFLEITGERPAVGTGFSPGAFEPGGPREVMISQRLWRERFAGDPSIVGRPLTLDGTSWTVVGVLSTSHDLPSANDDFLRPVRWNAAAPGPYWGFGTLRGVGRIAPGRTADDVRDELAELANLSRLENPLWTPGENYRAESRVTELQRAIAGDVRGRMLFLLGAVGLVLLVVTANVANLLLSRGLTRRQDRAVRLALGAGRGRLLASGLGESLILAVAGTALGVAIAILGLEALRPFFPEGLPRASSIDIDGRVLAVTATVASVVGIVTGLIASARGVSSSPAQLLRSGGRAGTGRERRTLSSTLVFAQIAVSVVLVTTAGLLVRSLGELSAVEPGFDHEELVTARLHVTPGRFASADEGLAFQARVLERLSSLPGVESAAMSGSIPFGSTREGAATWIDDVTDDPNALPFLDRYRVTPGWFETMGIELVEGRLIDARDVAGGEQVAVIDETAARDYFPDGALGRILRLYYPTADPIRIVGVVRSVRDESLAEPTDPTYYIPFAQSPTDEATVVVRAAGPSGPTLRAVRDAIAQLDAGIPLSREASYDELLAASMAESRLLALLTSLFGATTLLLGAIGLYGIASYMVREQTRDFGVRLALGADPATIRRRVVRSGLRLAVPGALLGLALAWPAGRVVEGLLFGVGALDPVTFVGVPILLLLTTVVAVWVPARRATRVEPARVLREE